MVHGLRALSAVLAIAGLAAVLCVVIISQADLRGASVLKQHVLKRNVQKPGTELVHYLKSDQDVSKPLRPRMHALSMGQIMNADSQNVDDLGSEFGPVKRLAVGPDGLVDEGSNSDLQLLNGLTRQDAKDSDVMDAVDASHMVTESKMFSLGKPKHDMAYDAERADRKGVVALGKAADRQPSFRMIKGDQSQMADMEHHHTAFHAVELDKETNSDDAQSDDLAELDLGSESEAESMMDPAHPLQAARASASKSKGIWIEPGSNKGYDSFALDSLQVPGTA